MKYTARGESQVDFYQELYMLYKQSGSPLCVLLYVILTKSHFNTFIE